MILLCDEDWDILDKYCVSNKERRYYLQLKVDLCDKGIIFKTGGKTYMANNDSAWCAETGEKLDVRFMISIPEIRQLANRRNKRTGYSLPGTGIKKNEKVNEKFVIVNLHSAKLVLKKLTKADIARLSYLGTYSAYTTGILKNGKGEVLNDEMIASKLKLSVQKWRELYERLETVSAITKAEEGFYLSSDFFYRGNKGNPGDRTQHLYIKAYRELFEKQDGRGIAQLAIIYGVLQFVERGTNVLTKNEKPMTLRELANELGYTGLTKFKTALESIRLHNEPVFYFVGNYKDLRTKSIVINPNLTFVGDSENLEKIRNQIIAVNSNAA